jgi:hypothetical protein
VVAGVELLGFGGGDRVVRKEWVGCGLNKCVGGRSGHCQAGWGDGGGHKTCPLWPQILPKFGAGFGRNGLGVDTGLGAALGAFFGPAMYVWTKRDRWGGFGASVEDALSNRLSSTRKVIILASSSELFKSRKNSAYRIMIYIRQHINL